MTVLACGVAAVVSALASRRFALRWRAGRARPSLLAWAVALSLLALASLALLIGAATSFSEPLFRLQYLFGAVLAVPWLALGTVLVHSHDRRTSRLTGAGALLAGLAFLPGALAGEPAGLVGAVLGLAWGLLLVDADPARLRVGSSLVVVVHSLLAVSLVLPAPLVGELPAAGLASAGAVLPSFVSAFAVAGTVVGTVVVVVGAIASAVGLLLDAGATDGAAGTPTPPADRTGRTRPPGSGTRLRAGWQALGAAGRRWPLLAEAAVLAGMVVLVGSGRVSALPDEVLVEALGIGLGAVLLSLGLGGVAGLASPGTP